MLMMRGGWATQPHFEGACKAQADADDASLRQSCSGASVRFWRFPNLALLCLAMQAVFKLQNRFMGHRLQEMLMADMIQDPGHAVTS